MGSFLATYEPYAATLIDAGYDFKPATFRTQEVARFEAFRTGFFLQWNMNEYVGRYNAWRNTTTLPGGRPATIPPPAQMNLLNMDMRSVVQQLKARGADYIVWTKHNEFGFLMAPSLVKTNMATQVIDAMPGGFASPAYPDAYHVVKGVGDQNLAAKFVAECRAVGVEPIFYYNLVNNLRLVKGNSFNVSGNGYTGSIPLSRMQELVDYEARCIQEDIMRYKLRYSWHDYGNIIPDWAIQKYYNAVKSVAPKCQVIGNAMMYNEFLYGQPLRFPCDIASTEEYFLINSPGTTRWQSNTVTHDGVDYYCGQELCGTPYDNWYWYPPNGLNPDFAGERMYPVASLSHWQDFINKARSYNRPLLTSIFLKNDGQILQNGLNYYDQLTF